MRIRAALALATTAALGLGFSLPGTGTELPDSRGSDNLELVAHLPGAGGTDLEFFTRTDLSTYKEKVGEDIVTITSETPVTRHFAMVGNQTSGAKIVDITDPEDPFVVGAMPESCTVGQGDIQVRHDARIAVVAWQTSGSCTVKGKPPVGSGAVIVDISDPYSPQPISIAAEDDGAHNVTLHPSGDYLYISTSGITDRSSDVPIYDVTDPANPERVTIWKTPGNSPHDIRFSPDGDRAYMAGVSQFRIVNTEDPEDPQLISVIVPPGGSIGHDTLITPDKRFLFLGDEGGGGATYPCPGGAVYVYDLLVEAAPVLLGAVEADAGPVTNRQITEPEARGVGGCTSHVMHLDPGARSFTIGWYTAGTRTFDFSALYDGDTPSPKPVAAVGPNGVGVVQSGWIVPEGANTWSAKQYEGVPGYIFSDDLNLGLYVTKILED